MIDTTWEPKDCNRRIAEETAEELSVSVSLVNGVIHHFSQTIATTIKCGAMEGVHVPYLGKFQVKVFAQQYKDYINSMHPDMRKLVKARSPKEVHHILNESHEPG